jgi:hypothetical protein
MLKLNYYPDLFVAHLTQMTLDRIFLHSQDFKGWIGPQESDFGWLCEYRMLRYIIEPNVVLPSFGARECGYLSSSGLSFSGSYWFGCK